MLHRTVSCSSTRVFLFALYLALNGIGAMADITPTRGGNQVSIPHVPHFTSYDYGPSMMQETDGRFRVWWCGNREETPWAPFVDTIYHSQAQTPTGPWSTPQKVFSVTGSTNYFDREGTCDPSVIKVRGTYYMYYSGYRDHVDPSLNDFVDTQIGIASSTDGINWVRLNGGIPIVLPRHLQEPPQPEGLNYGAGQASALFKDGWYYLIYSDSTGNPGQWGGNGHIYAMRSKSPQSSVYS